MVFLFPFQLLLTLHRRCCRSAKRFGNCFLQNDNNFKNVISAWPIIIQHFTLHCNSRQNTKTVGIVFWSWPMHYVLKLFNGRGWYCMLESSTEMPRGTSLSDVWFSHSTKKVCRKCQSQNGCNGAVLSFRTFCVILTGIVQRKDRVGSRGCHSLQKEHCCEKLIKAIWVLMNCDYPFVYLCVCQG